MRFFDKLENILELLNNRFPHNKLLLSGDFKIDLIPYESNAVCTNFLSLPYSYNCIPTIIKPTRVGSTSSTVIDNIFINNSINLKDCGVVLLNISDHFAIFNIYEDEAGIVQKDNYAEVTKRIMNEQNVNSLYSDIRKFDWNVVKCVASAEEAYNMFSDKIIEFLDANCLSKKIRVKKLDISKPYITSYIKRLIKEKHKLQRLYNKKPLTYGERYRKCRNNPNSVVRQAKENYFKSQLQNNTSNSRESWRIINSNSEQRHSFVLYFTLFIQRQSVYFKFL